MRRFPSVMRFFALSFLTLLLIGYLDLTHPQIANGATPVSTIPTLTPTPTRTPIPIPSPTRKPRPLQSAGSAAAKRLATRTPSAARTVSATPTRTITPTRRATSTRTATPTPIGLDVHLAYLEKFASIANRVDNVNDMFHNDQKSDREVEELLTQLYDELDALTVPDEPLARLMDSSFALYLLNFNGFVYSLCCGYLNDAPYYSKISTDNYGNYLYYRSDYLRYLGITDEEAGFTSP